MCLSHRQQKKMVKIYIKEKFTRLIKKNNKWKKKKQKNTENKY